MNKLFSKNEDKKIRLKLKKTQEILSNVIEKYKSKSIINLTADQKRIFMFWDNPCLNEAPFVVQQCIERIKYLYPDYNVVILNKENLSSYLDLNARILSLRKEGKISIQTFSDIVRVNLLKKYGGFWIDSTVYFPKRIELFDYLENNSFFSLNYKKENNQKIQPSLSKDMTWCSFLIGSRKNSSIAKFLVDAFNEFYDNHDFVIDYFMIDYLIYIAYLNDFDECAIKRIPLEKGYPFSLIECIENEGVAYDFNQLEMPQKLRFRMNNDEVDKLKNILNLISKKCN